MVSLLNTCLQQHSYVVDLYAPAPAAGALLVLFCSQYSTLVPCSGNLD